MPLVHRPEIDDSRGPSSVIAIHLAVSLTAEPRRPPKDRHRHLPLLGIAHHVGSDPKWRCSPLRRERCARRPEHDNGGHCPRRAVGRSPADRPVHRPTGRCMRPHRASHEPLTRPRLTRADSHAPPSRPKRSIKPANQRTVTRRHNSSTQGSGRAALDLSAVLPRLRRSLLWVVQNEAP